MNLFKPTLYPVEVASIKENLKPGDSFGVAGVVTESLHICYQKTEVNCKICVVDCPFNTNKERGK